MDTICGLGLPEMLILALVAFVLIGPERSQEVALQAGRFIRNIVTSNWWSEFNDVTDALRNLPTTLVRMAEIEEAQAEIRETIQDINQSTRVDMDRGSVMRGEMKRQQQDATTDPWGIANATAQTTFNPEEDAPTPAPEAPAPAPEADAEPPAKPEAEPEPSPEPRAQPYTPPDADTEPDPDHDEDTERDA